MTAPWFEADAFDELDSAPIVWDDQNLRSHLRIAARFAQYAKGRVLYVHGIGWHYWDGKRWAVDLREAHAHKELDALLRRSWVEAISDKDLQSDVRSSMTANGSEGVLRNAERRMLAVEVDADPFLLNCQNGTLDLRTHELREHDPGDMITKITAGAYDPEARSDVWESFLETVLPEADERGYLQRVAGQGVYGAVREHLFPVIYGGGGNGKGTWYEALNHALGDYSTIVNSSLLMAGGSREGGPEQMALYGVRLAFASETSEGRALNEAFMKKLSGGDTMRARHLYRDEVTWEPSHQLVYITNHKPVVKETKDGVWRRLRIVPFDVTISADQKVADLPEQLKLAADAILTWAVAGWFDYQAHGMREPEKVMAVTNEYKSESDDVAQFISDMCVIGQGCKVGSSDLLHAYAAWAAANNGKAHNRNTFKPELVRLGYEGKDTRNGFQWQGLGLLTDAKGGDGW